jgi:hypothetical protein
MQKGVPRDSERREVGVRILLLLIRRLFVEAALTIC